MRTKARFPSKMAAGGLFSQLIRHKRVLNLFNTTNDTNFFLTKHEIRVISKQLNVQIDQTLWEKHPQSIVFFFSQVKLYSHKSFVIILS